MSSPKGVLKNKIFAVIVSVQRAVILGIILLGIVGCSTPCINRMPNYKDKVKVCQRHPDGSKVCYWHTGKNLDRGKVK